MYLEVFIEMKIVKVQTRKNDKVVSVPIAMHPAIGDAEYMKCSVDEHGLHYTPLEA